MKSHLKRLFSDSAAFAVATIGNKLVAALLVPIYTRNLNESGQLADWGITNNYTLILTYLCLLGTDAAMAFYFYDAKDERDRKIYLTNAVLFSAGICFLFSLLAFFIGDEVASIIYKTDQDYTQLLLIATLATLFAIIIQHLLGYARYARRVWVFNLFSMSYVIGSSLLSVAFVVMGRGVLGLFYGQLIGQGIVAILLMILFRREFVFKPSKTHLNDLIRYGVPLLPTLVSFWVMTSVSQPIVYYLASIHHADIYAACLRLASMIVLITAPFQLAWRPFSMSIKDREDAKKIYGLVGRGLLVVGSLAIMLLAFVMKPLYQLFIGRPDLETGYLYVWALSLGTLFNVMHTVIGVGLLIKKQTQKISRAFIIAAVIYLLGNIVLVPLYAIWGAVTMSVVAYFVVIILVYFQNQKVYPVNFRFRSMMTYLVIYLGMMVFITWIQVNQLSNQWIYYVIIFFIMAMTVFATRLFSWQSLNQIGSFLPRLGGKR